MCSFSSLVANDECESLAPFAQSPKRFDQMLLRCMRNFVPAKAHQGSTEGQRAWDPAGWRLEKDSQEIHRFPARWIEHSIADIADCRVLWAVRCDSERQRVVRWSTWWLVGYVLYWGVGGPFFGWGRWRRVKKGVPQRADGGMRTSNERRLRVQKVQAGVDQETRIITFSYSW